MEYENEFLAKIISKDEEYLIFEKNTLIGTEDNVSYESEISGNISIPYLLEFLKNNFDDVHLNRSKWVKISNDRKLPKILGLLKFSESKM